MPPSHIKHLWIARDKDEAGDLAAERLRAKAEHMGIIVFNLHPVRNDFNDDLMEDGLMSLRANATAQVREQATKIPG